MSNLKYAFIIIVILILANNCNTAGKDTQNANIISSTSEENTYNELTPENELNLVASENTDSKDINLLNVLSTSELISSIYNYLPADIKLITNNDEIIFHFEDLDFDTIHEVFVIGVQYDEATDLNSFIDYSTLFIENRKPYHFYLYIFSAKGEEIFLLNTVDLGMQFVFNNIIRLKINDSFDTPFVIKVVFQVQEGEIQKWLIFDDSLVPESINNLEDTFSSKLVIEDIDSDGNIDIIIMERGAEEGTGFETFLTWLKWDDNKFEEYAATNIVRNLKNFLNNSKNYILERDWNTVINFCFDDYYTNRGWSNIDIIYKALGFEDIYGEDHNSKSIILAGLRVIVFPEIFENPFILEDDTGSYFNLTFRIEDSNGVTIISELPVYINKNPFEEKQFYFRMK